MGRALLVSSHAGNIELEGETVSSQGDTTSQSYSRFTARNVFNRVDPAKPAG
jgi:hypothetical protein